VLRTPSKPGTDPDCQCSDTTYGIALLLPSDPPGAAWRVTVTAPWHIKTSIPPSFCDVSASSQCVVVTAFVPLVLATDDPSAPARNVTFEIVPSNTQCP
jgi:hypothetical protein